MNYELAMRLKMAVFSQKRGYGKTFGGGKWLQVNGLYIKNPTTADNIVYLPTLSELIEACGNKFSQLVLDEGDWCAYQVKNNEGWFGDSPEMAVAKLWLEINEIK